MAEITRTANRTMGSIAAPPPNRLSGLVAGEALGQLDACYIKASDGKVYKSTGAAANAAAKVDGFADADTPAGEAVTLLHGMLVRYGSGLTPGARLYLSGTVAGGLADAASTGGVSPVGFVFNSTMIFIRQGAY